MKETPQFLRLWLMPILFFCCGIVSCSSTNGIDDYFTFNLNKSESIKVPPQIPVGQEVSGPFVVKIDSTDLITNTTLQTSLALTKSVKLTKLVFSTGESSYPMTSFDTVKLTVAADSLTDMLLATYSGSADMISLTDADFAEYIKKPSVHYTITSKANKAPAQTVNIAANYTLVFTSKPIQ